MGEVRRGRSAPDGVGEREERRRIGASGGRPLSRRAFLGAGASCLAHLSLMAAGAGARGRRLWAQEAGAVVAREPFGRLEGIGEGLWGLVSTPMEGDRTTLSNGGIVAGRAGVIVVESFASPGGAGWMAERARELTGRWPTHVVISHYHGDHSNGIDGFVRDGAIPRILTGAATRATLQERDAAADPPPTASRTRALADAVVVPGGRTDEIDLGDRVVRVPGRDGHTASDLTVELDDPSVVWCGDLVWNGMFPNYMDATPSRLSAAVRALRRDRPTVYVPGHGPLADNAEYDRYVAVIDHVEGAARRAAEAGIPAGEAASGFQLPPSLGEWTLFNPAYFERALAAWERELVG